MGYKVSSLDELGDGYGFRKVRAPLGVTAFGVNAIVYPPGAEGVTHYHDTQDELYFVHRGTARFVVDGKEHVTRLPDKSFHRTTWSDAMRRARALGVALSELGLARGDRVATLSWNHYQHLEAYFGIPCGGFVLHTLNLRLHPNDIGYIANHAGDRAVIVDRSLLPLLEQFRDRTQIEHVFVVEDSYEDLLASVDPDA